MGGLRKNVFVVTWFHHWRLLFTPSPSSMHTCHVASTMIQACLLTQVRSKNNVALFSTTGIVNWQTELYIYWKRLVTDWLFPVGTPKNVLPSVHRLNRGLLLRFRSHLGLSNHWRACERQQSGSSALDDTYDKAVPYCYYFTYCYDITHCRTSVNNMLKWWNFTAIKRMRRLLSLPLPLQSWEWG